MYGTIAIRLIIATGSQRSSRERPWVARITGEDSQYGLAREFQKPVYDYSRSTKKGKNTYVYYFLPPGMYEVWHPVSWKHDTRYFCEVKESGDVIKIEKNYLNKVLQCLKNDT